MGTLKDRLQVDLTAAMKARDELTTAALRMALSSVRKAEVAGKKARELSDDEVLTVLGREVKQRKEAAEAFAGGGRADAADRERAESKVLERYLPAQLSDDDLAAIVAGALAEHGLSGPGQMGAAMRVVQPEVAGRAAGSRVAAEVKRQLAAGS
jgi:uncharacterized protein YqeY